MTFEKQYEAWISTLLREATGERGRRLREDSMHAVRLFLQTVWWPAIGHFEYLHPEYEVFDFKDGTRYLDLAYLRPPYRIDFEIDGFGPHVRDITRWQFADDLMRQNHLIIDGWMVIRFSYDDVKEKPRRCQQIVQQILGRFFGHESPLPELTLKEKEIIRFAIRVSRPFAPKEVCEQLDISNRSIRMMLQRLVQLSFLAPASGTNRVRSYRLNPNEKLKSIY